MVIAIGLTISSCSGPAPKAPPPDDRASPDPCAVLDGALAKTGEFRELKNGSGDSDNCTRDEKCGANDKKCANREAGIRRQIRLDFLGVEFDNRVLSSGYDVRKTSVNGRRAEAWAQSNHDGSWSCNVVMRISKFRSARVVTVEMASSEPTCTAVRAVAEIVEPKILPELK